MDFVRPEVRIGIWRWREALIGMVVSLLGMIWAVTGVGLVSIIGTSFAVAGALIVFAGIQRARFRIAAGGRGVVHIDEGQVTYYGPVEGGSVSIADLSRVELDPTSKIDSDWVLHETGGIPLRIPTNAEGAEALFDVFAGLDGLRTEAMLKELNSAPDRQVVIWQSNVAALH